MSPPGGYNYRVGFFSNAQWWYPDSDVGLPPTTTSVLPNADWTANPAALAAGVTYSSYVTVRDVYGNEAQMQQNYTVASAPAPAGDSAAFAGALQGTWSACSFTGASYQAETLVVSGLNATRSVTDFGALDSTCSGSGTPVFSIPGTFTVGSAVNATFVAATVTAYPIDLTFSGVSFYDLAYIAPNGRLYLGDSSGTNDGSSPATRPIALSTSVEFVKRGASPPPSVDYSSAIQGTWTACFADPTRDFFINFAFNGSAGTYNEWSYPSTNGTCTGTEILEASEVVTFTLGAGVWSPFDGGPDVAAQQNRLHAERQLAGLRPRVHRHRRGAEPPLLRRHGRDDRQLSRRHQLGEPVHEAVGAARHGPAPSPRTGEGAARSSAAGRSRRRAHGDVREGFLNGPCAFARFPRVCVAA